MSELVIRRGLEEPDTTGEFVPHKPASPEKSMPCKTYNLVSEYNPSGDQQTAIAELTAGAREDDQTQVLLGVTGSGEPSPWPR